MESILSAWLIWLIAAAILVIIELLTTTYAALCLVGGCLAAMICAICDGGLQMQLLLAAIGTIVTFVAGKPLLQHYGLMRHHRADPSNMDALIGRTCTVSERIGGADEPGRVRIDGDSWQAVSEDGSPIETGTPVRVIRYDSIILTVKCADIPTDKH